MLWYHLQYPLSQDRLNDLYGLLLDKGLDIDSSVKWLSFVAPATTVYVLPAHIGFGFGREVLDEPCTASLLEDVLTFVGKEQVHLGENASGELRLFCTRFPFIRRLR